MRERHHLKPRQQRLNSGMGRSPPPFDARRGIAVGSQVAREHAAVADRLTEEGEAPHRRAPDVEDPASVPDAPAGPIGLEAERLVDPDLDVACLRGLAESLHRLLCTVEVADHPGADNDDVGGAGTAGRRHGAKLAYRRMDRPSLCLLERAGVDERG